MIYKLKFPNNVEYWQVFDSDSQLRDFLECAAGFSDIYFEGSNSDCKEVYEDVAGSDGVIQLKSNKIPKGLVSLEHLFRRKDDSTIKEKISHVHNAKEYDKIDIGEQYDPKWISIGQMCTSSEKEDLTKLLIEYRDVFAWGYEDLKKFKGGLLNIKSL